MKSYSDPCRQRGFTLVEIAIVLMIIGLLIGGILRGQELIQSARVRNIIDQKSAVQTAYIGFLDRYRMLPGDLTAAQAAVVGNGVLAAPGAGAGDGQLIWNIDSIVFFQNLTAAGFISCGACMSVVGAGAPTVSNTLINVYGDYLAAAHQNSSNTGASWFDPAPAPGVNRLIIPTGGSIPSQVLAEVDRKADDGLPGGGQLRFHPMISSAPASTCAPGMTGTPLVSGWANPSQANCAGAWLF
jgi:prepilin-type N-terminal cleavage/methylation domain-containing protein